MIEQFLSFLGDLMDQTGLAHLWWGNVVMIAIGCAMIYLAIAKGYEPLLLVGIGFSCIISNVPGSDLTQPGGLFHYAYQGVQLLIVPPLIFFGVGAMTDFAPMIANPKLVILGAAAHLGIFVALIGAKLLGFTESDMQILMGVGKLTPLGDPALNAPKWFAAVEVIRLATDQEWLHKATKEIAKYWRNKRERHQSSGASSSLQGLLTR